MSPIRTNVHICHTCGEPNIQPKTPININANLTIFIEFALKSLKGIMFYWQI